MGYIRMVLRLAVLVVWSATILGFRLVLWPVALVSPRFDRRVRRAITRVWGKVFFPVLGAKVVQHGSPPEHPFFLVSNHLSYVDSWLLNGLVGCTFVARGDLANWPVLGAISKCLNVLFIDRQNKRDTKRINELIEETLRQGDGLVIFAESRISRGLDVLPFKSSLIEPAVANGIPVHYCTLTYETKAGCPPASDVVGWWRPEPFLHHLFRLLQIRGFTVTVKFGEHPLEGNDRKALARDLTEAVRKNYVAYS